MPTDGATAKFLYTIIKQLDLKSVRIPRAIIASKPSFKPADVTAIDRLDLGS